MTMKTLRLLAVAAASAALLLVGAGCSQTDDSAQSSGEDNLNSAEAPVARFAPYLKTLRTTLESGQSADQIAQTLLSSGRPASFSLQALCRLYEKESDTFKTLRDDFKGLEDGIGQFDKWNGFYQAAVAQNKDAATLQRLKAQSDAALATFSQLLTSKGWITTDAAAPSLAAKHEAWLKAYKWKVRAEDRNVVLSHLSKELGDLTSTTYDMKVLEEGDGVHELRRDLRWVLIEQLGLNGMITLNPATCAIPAYAALPITDRYTQLKSSALEPSPCQIDACVVAAAAKAVNALGNVKDQAEEEVNLNGDADVVPVRLQPEAQALYTELTTNKVFEVYKSQLDACKTP
jgi:hypothetical protein